MDYDLSRFDVIRSERGLMKISEIMELIDLGNVIFDPFSTLISSRVTIGTGNIIHPCVSIITNTDGGVTIGNGNTFYSNSSLEADGAEIIVGSHNQFGEGGFTAKANRNGARILFANNGRYTGGPSVFGASSFGDGCQLIGAITVDSCTLEGGESWQWNDPDARGALLKGFGVARGISLERGEVISGQGSFGKEDVKLQSFFHPKVGASQ